MSGIILKTPDDYAKDDLFTPSKLSVFAQTTQSLGKNSESESISILNIQSPVSEICVLWIASEIAHTVHQKKEMWCEIPVEGIQTQEHNKYANNLKGMKVQPRMI